jgi:hypothetical protein
MTQKTRNIIGYSKNNEVKVDFAVIAPTILLNSYPDYIKISLWFTDQNGNKVESFIDVDTMLAQQITALLAKWSEEIEM